MEESGEGVYGVGSCDLFFSVDSDVSQFDDIGKYLPGVAVNSEAETWFVDECLDVIPVWGAEAFVCGIYSFDGKL